MGKNKKYFHKSVRYTSLHFGFSIIEILVAIAILGILVGIAVPRIRQSSQEASYKKDISAFVDFVKQHGAMARSGNARYCATDEKLNLIEVAKTSSSSYESRFYCIARDYTSGPTPDVIKTITQKLDSATLSGASDTSFAKFYPDQSIVHGASGFVFSLYDGSTCTVTISDTGVITSPCL